VVDILEFQEDLLNNKKYQLTLHIKLLIAIDTAQGMNFLHSSNILHRDLKPDNLLVSTFDPTAITRVKINDFGTSRELVSNISMTANITKAIGTPAFMAPEILNKQPYKFPADVFSYGVTLYHLFAEIEPYFNFQSVFQIAGFVTSGKRLDIPTNIPREIRDLIKITWSDNPDQRRGFPEIVGYLTLLKDSIDINESKFIEDFKGKVPVEFATFHEPEQTTAAKTSNYITYLESELEKKEKKD